MSFSASVHELVETSEASLVQAASAWPREPLGNVASILNGFPFKSDHFTNGAGDPLIRIRDVTSGRTETRYAGPRVDGYWVEPGDLVVGMDGDFNSRIWTAERGLLNQRVCKITPDEQVLNLRFLSYLLPGYLQLINEATHSVTVKHLSSKTLQELPLPVPPLAEQRRIVAKLDALMARTARARADLDRIPALATHYKQAALAKAFSGELTGSNGMGWRELPISEIADVGTGSTPKRSQAAYYQGGSIPWVTSSVVNRVYVDSADEFITEQALRETNCKIFEPGTLLVAMYGEGQTRGRVSVLGIAAATNQALAAISLASENIVRRDYLYWFLRSQYLVLRRAAAGGVQPNLNLGIIKATRVPVPPLEEQVEIVRLVDRAFSEIDRMTTEAVSALRLLDRLDQAVLAKAFQGELVLQDPADEPANILLDRIRAERARTPKAIRGRRTAVA
ncbi:restriction endonuclease subunit S [Caulobacter soli]|uniref:restriction endonuclease subunit S n=1 Tax=Caulobacter soli TaxID=2708539 RepID=UPI0013ED71A0|nr:restriction endonuclease subunit S [Caulobacter soli]